VKNFHEGIVKHNELLIVKVAITEKRRMVNIEDCFNFQQVGDIIFMPWECMMSVLMLVKTHMRPI